MVFSTVKIALVLMVHSVTSGCELMLSARALFHPLNAVFLRDSTSVTTQILYKNTPKRSLPEVESVAWRRNILKNFLLKQINKNVNEDKSFVFDRDSSSSSSGPHFTS